MELKKLRKERKLTQGDVARLVGVSMMTYQLWERGHMNPSAENLEKLKKVLGEK
jgi:transcriptional regulator with XRE-family HTH domain